MFDYFYDFNSGKSSLMGPASTQSQAIAFVSRAGVQRQLQQITAGYTAQNNVGQASPYVYNTIIGRVVGFLGDISVESQRTPADIYTNFNQLSSTITFDGINRKLFDLPVYDVLVHNFKVPLTIQSIDTLTIMLCMGLEAIDADQATSGTKVGYLNVFGDNIAAAQNPDNAFKYILR